MSDAPGSPIPTAAPPQPVPGPETPLDAVLAAEWARELLVTISDTKPRSLQASIGPSEIGQRCDRRIAYRLTSAPMVNLSDPLKALVGIGTHAALAEGLARLDPSRYLIEQPVRYRGISGTVDLYDAWKRRLVDWKTSSARRINRYRYDGVPANYVTQTAIYAEGLIAAGYPVDTIALVFIPRDGLLSDIYAWTTLPNAALADEAIDRYREIDRRVSAGEHPADFTPWPSALCPYCPNYSPGASDLAVACPGKDNAA
jgi:hypothetical protein